MSIRRNSIYNLAGALTPVLVTLLTVPAYIKAIGEERFGVLSIAWLLLGYFGLFDLGLSRATAQRMATLRSESPAARVETFWTALFLNASFGVLGGLLIWPAANIFFTHYFRVSEAIRSETVAAIPWLLAAVPVATISGVLSGALEGRERFLTINIVNINGTVLFQLLPLCVALIRGPDLTLLIPIALLGRVLTFSLLFFHCRRHVPLAGPPSINRSLIPVLLKFGGWVTITGLVSPILSVVDRVIIGAVAGAKAVTFYTVPFNLTNRITIIPASLTSALFPRLATATGSDLERLWDDAVRVLAVVITPAVIAGLAGIDWFLCWWVGVELAAKTALVGKLLLFGLWANCLAYIPFSALQAKGRPDLVAKCHLLELVPYLAALSFSLPRWGVAGAALVWSLRAALDFVLLYALSGAVVKVARLLAFPMLFLLLAALTLMIVDKAGFVGSGAMLNVLVLCCLAWSWKDMPESLARHLPGRSVVMRQ